MFRDVFSAALSGRGPAQAEILYPEVAAAYSASGRHYHNLAHLDALCSELQTVQDEIADWDTLVFSIAYHDFVYHPLKSDNEERSADKAESVLKRLNCSEAQVQKCRAQILATKGHALSTDGDINLFTDADLSILGAPREKYRRYAAAIRKEYRLVPHLLYKPGRKKVLDHFLSMDRIFKTGHFHAKYEAQARSNLHWERNGTE